ncbi:MAG: Isopentenyl-diphosphate Delta-isomerase [candidate division WS6 bacterium OLB20]|uniref:Isopentenyl-diphosphate Delta-isomerase n=1 Tax=candidate division WS6 bacterium OLB20 TaxID=1617426 RepID=A0A136M065_9BACT|nr:MAG: Isopentenyl-diphosphate Delta-isomerase [candidate division WS6 bacterium OLB20]
MSHVLSGMMQKYIFIPMSKDAELLDIVDREGNVIGRATRDEAHANPELIHQVVHCWLFNTDGQVLLQQRSLTKDLGAGMWDVAVGGHLMHGETAVTGLAREMEEELGIVALKARLADTYIAGTDSQTEYIYVFTALLPDDTQLQFDQQEIETIAWFDLTDLYTESMAGRLPVTNWIHDELPGILQTAIADYLTNS